MFINAVMLAGIGGAVVPLVLHLLNRYRFRTVEWGAMMFLVGNDPRETRRNRLKQLLLLLIRMGLVAVLAVCLARPVVRAAWAPGSAAPASVVILLDRSPAMGYSENRQTRFSLAKGAVASILSGLHSGDEVTLVTLGDAPGAGEPERTTDLAALADRVQGMSVGPAVANMADGLNRAAEILAGSSRINRTVFVVCGREASAWKQVDAAFSQAWMQRWSGSQSPPKLVVAAVGSDGADNVALTQVRLLHPPALRNRMMEAEATIHNYGPAPHSHVLVKFLVAGKQVATATVSVGPNGEATARQMVLFPDVGSHVLSASIPTVGLSSDNTAQLSVDVMDSLPVMLLGQTDDSFISLALAPFHGAGREGPDLSLAGVFDPGDPAWTEKLSDFRVVILADVAVLSPAQVQALEMFVYDGGGLLIAPGGRVRAADYNDALYKDGTGLMPAMLQSPTPVDGSASTTLGKIDLSSDVFDFLRDKPDFAPSPVIRRYYPATPGPGAQTVAAYAGGQPFLIGGSFGHGRVLLATTPLDETWGTLPLDSFFLPFVQSAAAWLAAQPSVRNLELGQELVAAVETAAEGKTLKLTRPGGLTQIDVMPVRVGDRLEVRYLPDRPGEYELTGRLVGPDKQLHFVVRRPPGVSDLTAVTEKEWGDLSRQLGFEFIDGEHRDVTAELGAGPEERELWPWMLGMVLTLAVLEVGLERMWTSESP